MTNLMVIENKLSFIKKYLTILAEYKSKTLESIMSDTTLTGALERHLYLAIQATIDCAEAIIAYKNLRKPTSYKEAFEILFEDKIISREFCEKMIRMVGFRNIITHGYTDIDYKILYKVLTEDVADVEDFVALIENYFKL